MKLLPIRISAGWLVRWNTLCEDEEDNHSQDLLWLQHLDINNDNKPDGLFIDIGRYGDLYTAILAENWEDKPFVSSSSKDIKFVMEAVENWMVDWYKLNRHKTWRDNPVPRFHNPLEDDDLLEEK